MACMPEALKDVQTISVSGTYLLSKKTLAVPRGQKVGQVVESAATQK